MYTADDRTIQPMTEQYNRWQNNTTDDKTIQC